MKHTIESNVKRKKRVWVSFSTRIISGSYFRNVLLPLGLILPGVLNLIFLVASTTETIEYVYAPLYVIVPTLLFYSVIYFRCGIFIKDDEIIEQRLFSKDSVKIKDIIEIEFDAARLTKYTASIVSLSTTTGKYMELITASGFPAPPGRKARYKFARSLVTAIHQRGNTKVKIKAPRLPEKNDHTKLDRAAIAMWGGVKEYALDSRTPLPKIPLIYYF